MAGPRLAAENKPWSHSSRRRHQLRASGQELAVLKSPDYKAASDAAWQAGDALQVSAQGADVEAFTGTLLAPQELTGLGPPLQQTPVVIAHDAPLLLSWQPEGKPGEEMYVAIDVLLNGGSRSVQCRVPDADGSVTVDPSLLAPLVPGTDAIIHLVRSLSTSASSANAVNRARRFELAESAGSLRMTAAASS